MDSASSWAGWRRFISEVVNYYNEFDKKAAAWIRELIADRLIPKGEVDERSITDVRAGDLRGFVQCHFFAGIAGWSLALRLAGWPEDRPIWSGSCPCQPFSCAGKGKGTADERHLWPVFAKLIGECKPPVVVGEQVASKAGRDWLAGVFADLEGMGYQRAGADLCSAGVGAPNIRQRLFWMAQSAGVGCGSLRAESAGQQRCAVPDDGSTCRGMADTQHAIGRPVSGPVNDGRDGQDDGRQEAHGVTGTCGEVQRLADSEHSRHGMQRDGAGGQRQSERGGQRGGMGVSFKSRLEGHDWNGDNRNESRRLDSQTTGPTPAPGFWSDAIWNQSRDGKARRISPEPALFPLAPRLPGRVGLLRGAGNAINAQLAAVFIQSVMDVL